MKKEIAILLLGLVTGAAIMKVLGTDSLREVQLDLSKNEQLAIDSVSVLSNSRLDKTASTRDKSDGAIQDDADKAVHDSSVTPLGESDNTVEFTQPNAYQATALQLARIADNAQWLQSFQGNYSADADATNTQLTRLADTLTRQFGSYYASGCNQQFCALLAEGFADRQQADAAVEQILGSKHLPNFKYYRIIEDETGTAIRFSIPIDQNYAPTTAELTAFSTKFKTISP